MERTGCCHCGSLRVTVTGEPTVVNTCHCKACQRRTGAVMHSGVYFKKSQVRIEGPEKVYTREAQEGRKISFHFCPTCGSSVYWHLDLRPEHCGIAVGAFADPDFPPPSFSVWEETKHPWINLPDGTQHFGRPAYRRELQEPSNRPCVGTGRSHYCRARRFRISTAKLPPGV